MSRPKTLTAESIARRVFGALVATLALTIAFAAWVAAPAQAKDDPPTQIHRGILSSRPAGQLGAWVVGGRTFTADANTEFDTLDGPLTVGACVKVRYFAGDLADEIDSEPPQDCASATPSPTASPSPSATPVTFIHRGLINSRPSGNTGTWVVGGRAFAANAGTEFDTTEGALVVGACAKVRFFTSGGIDIADEIDSEPPQDCGLSGTPAPTPSVTPSPTAPPVTSLHRGLVESRPIGLLGTWVVGGQSFVANNETEFEFDEGTLAVGSCAKVRYFENGGARVADEIDAEPQGDCGSSPVPPPSSTPDPAEDSKVYARIDAFPPAPFVGLWKIGGVDYQANSSTEFEQEDGAFAVGICVKAEFVPMNGVSTLNEVETEDDYKCQAAPGDPAGTFKAYGVIDSFSPSAPSTWVISGISYTVQPTTSLEANEGSFKVGAFVEVKYALAGAARVASKIETHTAPGFGAGNALGALQTRPSDDWGAWVIDGVSYQGDPAMRVSLPAQAGGVKVAVNYVVRAGVNFATLIRAMPNAIYAPVMARP